MTEQKNICGNCKHFVNELLGYKFSSRDKNGNIKEEKEKGICISHDRNRPKEILEEVVPINYTCFYHEKEK